MQLEFNPYFYELYYEKTASRFHAALEWKIEVVEKLASETGEVLSFNEEEVKTMAQIDE